MKKTITSAIAAGLLLGSTAVTAAPVAIDRASAEVTDAENLSRNSGWLVALLAAAIAAGIVFLIEDNEDDDFIDVDPVPPVSP